MRQTKLLVAWNLASLDLFRETPLRHCMLGLPVALTTSSKDLPSYSKKSTCWIQTVERQYAISSPICVHSFQTASKVTATSLEPPMSTLSREGNQTIPMPIKDILALKKSKQRHHNKRVHCISFTTTLNGLAQIQMLYTWRMCTKTNCWLVCAGLSRTLRHL